MVSAIVWLPCAALACVAAVQPPGDQRHLSGEAPARIAAPHDPAHATNAVDWCAAHMARREIAQALSDCEHAVAKEPKNPRALSNRGSVWLMSGDAARALQDFEAALALAPEDAGLYFNRGLAYAKLGASDAAIADYSDAIRRKPDLAIAYHNRGYEHELKGREAAAIGDYRKALEIDPKLSPPAEGLKRLLRGRT